MDLDTLIAKARDHKMSPAEREAQRRSFVYGNVHLSNPNVTREVVEKAAIRLNNESEIDGD